MTQLPEKMLEELQRRNYFHRTARTYVRIVRDFAEHFHLFISRLTSGPEQIPAVSGSSVPSQEVAPATVSPYGSALRFLFVKTLRRHFLGL